MFCSNSPHQKDGNYQIKGTLKPQVFEAWGIQEQISIVCDKYGIPYGYIGSNNNNNNSNNYDVSPSIQELFTPGTKILEGHNRHLGILREMDSLLLKNMGFLTLEQIKKLAYERNQKLCVPPLDDMDMERQWKQSLEWANRKIREREVVGTKQKGDEQERSYSNRSTSRTTNTTKTKLQKQDLIEEATRLLLSKHKFLTIIENEEILYYDEEKGVYIKGGEILIEKEIDKIFGFKLRTSDITEIKNYVIRKTYVKCKNLILI